jgi:hypothetical protein
MGRLKADLPRIRIGAAMTMTPAFQRFAAVCAFLVALGAIVYAILFIAIVEGAGSTAYEWWFFLLMIGGVGTVPVFAALCLRLSAVDSGLALTALALGVLAAFGGIMHGAYNLGRLVTPRADSIPPGSRKSRTASFGTP